MLLPEAPKGAVTFRVVSINEMTDETIQYEVSFPSHKEAEDAFMHAYGLPIKGDFGDAWVAFDSEGSLLAIIPAS